MQTRPGCTTTTVTSIMPAKPTPAVDAPVPPSEMRRCSLLEPDNGQCRWPLGEVHQVVAQFCGDAAVPGSPYCGHHLRMARYDRGHAAFRVGLPARIAAGWLGLAGGSSGLSQPRQCGDDVLRMLVTGGTAGSRWRRHARAHHRHFEFAVPELRITGAG